MRQHDEPMNGCPEWNENGENGTPLIAEENTERTTTMTAVPEGTTCEMEWRSHGVEGSWHCYGLAIAYRDINGELVAICRDCLYDMDKYDDEFERWAVLL